jgi:hydroxyethylthiazole kinase-like sugar kinase family protein
MENNQTFDERKQAALKAAQEQGIVDVVTGANDGISPETVNLAADLMKKHRASAYERLETRRNAQE